MIKGAVKIEKDDGTIRITDENGKEIEFVVIDELSHKDSRYILVVEKEIIDDDDAEAVILKKVGESEDEMVFEELDDDEFDVVAGLFDEHLEDFDLEY